MKLAAFVLCFLVFVKCQNELPVVDEFDSFFFTGSYYLMYTSAYVAELIEGECVQGNLGYRFFNQTHWDVCDTLNEGDVGGGLGFLNAVQYLTDEVGKLEEFIVEQNGTLNFNDVWIVGLGPVVNDGYQWTMLAYPNRLHLYIFARDVDDYFALYENSTLALADELGFNGQLNSPVTILQSDDCVYPTADQVAVCSLV